MIDKKEAKKHNFKMIEQSKNENLKKLKKLFPELINSDNQLNIGALQDFVDISKTTSNNKGYELTFAGKGIARAKADSETEYELKFEKEQSKNERTKNTIIRGDNLEVLKILKQNYHEKIKMIYIDPPYNTKSDNFIYQDNFIKNEKDLIENFSLDENTIDFLQNVYSTKSHSGWLSFMYPRLKLARDLLKEQGVIFISIDDNEMANLKIICDEIFGEENFVASFIWQKTYSPKNNNKYVSDDHEYILCYAKNLNSIEKFYRLKRNEKSDNLYKYDDNDGKGKYRLSDLTIGEAKGYDIKWEGKIFSEPPTSGWRFGESRMYELIKEGRIYLPKDENKRPSYKRYLSEVEGIISKTILPYEKVGHTDSSKKALDKLIGLNIFDYPKPIDLIKHFLKITTKKQDLVLDFFAGSGTTGDAVFQINKEDGGNRKFILVQLDEKIKEKTEAFKFCKANNFEPVISSITIERLNRAGEKLQKEQNGNLDFDNQKLDVGYKVFSLKKKPKIREENELFKLENERANEKDTLANMLCGTGKVLHADLKELKKDILYLLKEQTEEGVEKSLFVLGNIESADLVGFEDANIYMDGYADISLEKFLNLFGMNEKEKERVRVVY